MTATPMILDRLESVKRSGNGWSARCPAHDDKSPSLSINVNDAGVALIRCHAGCSAESVMAAINLPVAALWPDFGQHEVDRKLQAKLNGSPKPQKPAQKAATFATAEDAIRAYERRLGKPTAKWEYHDKRGEVCGMVIRWDQDGAKDIRPVSRGEGGRWHIKAMSEPRPLFRLPELSGHPRIWIGEGEKVADALAALGLPATTSPGGSQAASGADWRTLAGRDIIIMPDNDAPGRKYAATVAGILNRIGCTVKILELPDLPEAGDVADLIDDRRTDGKSDDAIKRELIDLADTAEPWEPAEDDERGPVLTCLADVEPCEISWLWPGRVPLGRITLIVGRPGEGKSFLTTDMAARVSTGRDWIDGEPCPLGSVILVSAEDDPGDTIRPRLDAHGADVRKVHLLSAVRSVGKDGKPQDSMFTLADLPALESALKRTPDCRLIVIDPIGSFMGGRTDAHRDNEVRGVLAPVAQLAERYGAAVVIVAHRRKSAGSIADDTALGSRAFTGIARAVWHLSRDPADKSRRLLLAGKNNLAPEGDGLAFTITGHPPMILWEPEPVTMNADDALAVENTGGDDGARTKRESAAEWLKDALADGPVETLIVKRMAKQNCISDRTLADAKNDIGAESRKLGFSNGAKWYWCLPGTWDEGKVKADTEECKVSTEVCKGENSASFEDGLHPSSFQAKNGDSGGGADPEDCEGCKDANSASFRESGDMKGVSHG